MTTWCDIPGWTCDRLIQLYDEQAARLVAQGLAHCADIRANLEELKAGSRYASPPAPVIVEVGVAYGRSLAYMAGRMGSPFDHDHTLYGFDVWRDFMGGDNLPPETFAAMRAHGSPMAACVASMQDAGVLVAPLGSVGGDVHLAQMSSNDAAAYFPKGSVDFCFLDDEHTYEALSVGIKAWLPKIRKGGVLAGHDINDHYEGVQRAVLELLPDAEIRTNHGGWGGCWIHRVPS